MPRKNKFFPCLFITLLCTSAMADEVNQSIIESDVEPDRTPNRVYEMPKSSEQSLGDASLLFHISGLTITESGGPIAPSTLRYRGLSASRLPVRLEGLRINNPATGMLDANSMFLFAAKNLQTQAQSLLITLPDVDKKRAKAVFGYGSQHSVKVGSMVQTPLTDHSSAFFASQLLSSAGDFSFQAPSGSIVSNAKYQRKNNDQMRLQTVSKYKRSTKTSSQQVLLAANAHEGGVPGFAFTPTPFLRNKTLYLGLLTEGTKKINTTLFSAAFANSVFDYESYGAFEAMQEIVASAHELSLSVRPLDMPSWIDMELGQKVIVERAYGLRKNRIGGGFFMKRTSRFKGRLKPEIFSNFSMIGYGHEELVFEKDLGASIELNPSTSLIGRFARSQRLPTFIEMYANNTFFEGTPDLKKESVWDIELGTNIKLAHRTNIELISYLGFLSDVVVYAPRFAGRVKPVNSGRAKRHGIDLSIKMEPTDYLAIETKNGLLHTKVRATNRPMPNAPPFLGMFKIRFGHVDFLHASLVSRYRTSSFANLYGSLKTNGYALFDLHTGYEVNEHIGLSFVVSNIFNHQKARDTYEMPLPGTMFFGQIEIRSN